MRRAIIFLTALCSLYGTSLLGQGEIDDQQRIFYRNERSYAAVLQTDGYQLSYREGRRIDLRNKVIYEIEFGMFRHPREIRITNPYYGSNNSFIFGKLHNPFYLRGGIGRQHEMFLKEYRGGIAIRYFYSGGAVLSVNKPIYYRVLHPQTPTSFILKNERFHDDIQWPYDIFGRASFFRGFNEITLIPGLYGKGGFNFEYSPDDRVIHALEIGATLNAFPKKIPIMATEDNRALKLALFASYRIGIIIDPLDPASARIRTLFLRNR